MCIRRFLPACASLSAARELIPCSILPFGWPGGFLLSTRGLPIVFQTLLVIFARLDTCQNLPVMVDVLLINGFVLIQLLPILLTINQWPRGRAVDCARLLWTGLWSDGVPILSTRLGFGSFRVRLGR
jgi:hypothetical protein